MLEVLENEKEHYLKQLHKPPQGYPSGTSYLDADCMHGSSNQVSLDNLYSKIENMQKDIEDEKKAIEYLQKQKEVIKVQISQLSGVNYKVQILKLQGKKLQEIADELGYSYQYIKLISCKI